jgi:DNA-binding phage protein
MTTQQLADVLRQAMIEDGRTLYELAKEATLETDQLYRFRDGADLRLSTASKLAEVLGLELRPKKRTRNGR